MFDDDPGVVLVRNAVRAMAWQANDVCCLLTTLTLCAAGGLKLRHDRKGLLSVANQGPSELWQAPCCSDVST